jgi:hypothetical protein
MVTKVVFILDNFLSSHVPLFRTRGFMSLQYYIFRNTTALVTIVCKKTVSKIVFIYNFFSSFLLLELNFRELTPLYVWSYFGVKLMKLCEP